MASLLGQLQDSISDDPKLTEQDRCLAAIRGYLKDRTDDFHLLTTSIRPCPIYQGGYIIGVGYNTGEVAPIESYASQTVLDLQGNAILEAFYVGVRDDANGVYRVKGHGHIISMWPTHESSTDADHITSMMIKIMTNKHIWVTADSERSALKHELKELSAE